MQGLGVLVGQGPSEQGWVVCAQTGRLSDLDLSLLCRSTWVWWRGCEVFMPDLFAWLLQLLLRQASPAPCLPRDSVEHLSMLACALGPSLVVVAAHRSRHALTRGVIANRSAS